jgi:hypothetical protein
VHGVTDSKTESATTVLFEKPYVMYVKTILSIENRRELGKANLSNRLEYRKISHSAGLADVFFVCCKRGAHQHK